MFKEVDMYLLHIIINFKEITSLRERQWILSCIAIWYTQKVYRESNLFYKLL